MANSAMRQGDLTAHQRAAKATFWLREGKRMTTAEIANLCGVKNRAARYMLTNMSAVLPIAQDEQGYWHWLRAYTSVECGQ